MRNGRSLISKPGSGRESYVMRSSILDNVPRMWPFIGCHQTQRLPQGLPFCCHAPICPASSSDSICLQTRCYAASDPGPPNGWRSLRAENWATLDTRPSPMCILQNYASVATLFNVASTFSTQSRKSTTIFLLSSRSSTRCGAPLRSPLAISL